jgi:hypothetical protein
MSTRRAFKPRKNEVYTPVELSGLYRSTNYPGSHAVRKVGNMHMHLDCSHSTTSDNRLVEIAQTLEKHGWASKVSRVSVAKPGAHLVDPEYRDDYREHTPELVTGKNTFAAYLTTFLAAEVNEPKEAADLCKKARAIMQSETSGFSEAEVVIEIERVAALIDADNIQAASPPELSYHNEIRNSLFEIHHFIDLPHTQSIEFEEWQALCNLSGIVVGGWFQFNKQDVQALRSVRFTKKPNLLSLANETRELAKIVRESTDIAPDDISVQTVVEQVTDIWRL